MDNKSKHIEELFKDRFENFEHPVSENVWQAIESQIAVTPTPPSGAGSVGGNAITGAASVGIKALPIIISGVAAVVLITAGIWYFNSDNTPANTANAPATQAPASVITPEEQSNTPQENTEATKNQTETTSPAQKSPGPQHSERLASEPANNSTSALSSEGESSNVSKTLGGTASAQPKANQPVTNVEKPAPAETKPSKATVQNPQQNIARIRASITSGTAPLKVEFYNAGNGQILWWNFGEEFPRNSETRPTHQFNEAGVRQVVLAAVNESGKVFFDTLAISVRAQSAIAFAPNVITPNGDGINDTFELQVKYMAYLQVDIFVVNGKKVYGWEGLDGKWAGKNMSGEPLPGGTYFYSVIAIGKDSEKHTSNGMIRLIR